MDYSFDTINFEEINPAEYNPRLISDTEYSQLGNSIKEFGLVDPIIINLKNNKIIGGHQRFKVLTEEYTLNPQEYETLPLLRLGDIGWIFTNKDLELNTEEEEKALNIALNKISGEWDYPKLNLVIDDLLDDHTFDIDLTGFDMLDMKDLNIDLDKLDNEPLSTGDDVGVNGKSQYSMVITCRTTDELNHIYSQLESEGYKLQIR